MKDIIVTYLAGFIISLLQELYKSLAKKRLSEPTATQVRLIGGVLAVIAAILTHLGQGTLDSVSFSSFVAPLKDALVYFLASVLAYHSAIKDSRLNFSR